MQNDNKYIKGEIHLNLCMQGHTGMYAAHYSLTLNLKKIIFTKHQNLNKMAPLKHILYCRHER